MSEVRLVADVRTEFGKGGARRTRRAGKIPAVIYGHGAEPRHVSIPAREFSHAIKHGVNVLLTISINGEDQLAIPKAIQRNAVKGGYEHIDLLAVRHDEKVTVEVPLNLLGEVAPGGLLEQEHMVLSVEAEATNLPTEITFTIAGFQAGTQLLARDVELPAGVVLVTDPEVMVARVSVAPTAEDMEAAGAPVVAESQADTEDASE